MKQIQRKTSPGTERPLMQRLYSTSNPLAGVFADDKDKTRDWKEREREREDISSRQNLSQQASALCCMQHKHYLGSTGLTNGGGEELRGRGRGVIWRLGECHKDVCLYGVMPSSG